MQQAHTANRPILLKEPPKMMPSSMPAPWSLEALFDDVLATNPLLQQAEGELSFPADVVGQRLRISLRLAGAGQQTVTR